VQADVASARQMIEPLMAAFQIDCRERGGKLVFSSRAKRSSPAQALTVLADVEGEALWSEKRGQESDFATQATIGYDDEASGYERAVARSRRIVAGNERVSSLNLAGVLFEAAATAAAEEMLRDQRISRRNIAFRIPPFDFGAEPGDIVSLPDIPGRFRITRIEDGETRVVEAAEYAPLLGERVFTQSIQRGSGSDISANFAPLVVFLDLPKLGSQTSETYASAAVLARPWQSVALSSSPILEGYQLRASARRPATIGRLTAPLGAGVSGRFDFSATVEADLAFGSFSSATRLQVLGGANRLAVLATNGVYEIVSFLDARETASNHWQLSGLLRGQFGTEDAMLAGAEAGAAIVLLDEAVISLGLDGAETGLALNWIATSGDRRAGPWSFVGATRAATPLSPVHLRAVRDVASGGIAISWVRRSRDGADNWEAYDIPLDEPHERYRVEILSAGETVRATETDLPRYLYAQADELSDFGAPQTALTFRVCQIGWTVASGLPAAGTFNL
jgi:hypothetical protein